MIFRIHGGATSTEAGSRTVSLRCPACRQMGTFLRVVQHDAHINVRDGSTTRSIVLGQRQCPNPRCRAHAFVALEGADLLVSYPAERIDFDSTSIPQPVVDALEEAIASHANRCFVAAAIMVRKTLEELCRDRDAEGSNLKKRIESLATKVVLPQELLDGLDDLRLMGNDAAHIDSTVYNEIGENEVEVGIDVAKEVLKAVYQYSALIERLRELKS